MYSRKSVGPRMEPWGTPSNSENVRDKILSAKNRWVNS